MRRVNLIVITLLVAAPAAAEIYQWRDAQGQVHYSDTPPADVSAEPMRRASRPMRAEKQAAGEPAASAADANTDPAPPKTLAEKEIEFRQRRAEAAEASAKAAAERQQAEARRRDCERARSQLAALESGQRFARFNPAGEREVIDDAMRAEEIARTRGYVESACK